MSGKNRNFSRSGNFLKCQGILAIWLVSGSFVITIELFLKMIRKTSYAIFCHTSHSSSKWFIINIPVISCVYYCLLYLMSLHCTKSANFSHIVPRYTMVGIPCENLDFWFDFWFRWEVFARAPWQGLLFVSCTIFFAIKLLPFVMYIIKNNNGFVIQVLHQYYDISIQ